MPIRTAVGPAHDRPSPGQAEGACSPRYALGLLVPAALLTLAAATVHLFVAPGHFMEYVAYGIAFVATGLAEAGLAVLIVVAPGRRVFAAAAAIAVGCLVVWGLSRTVGLPLGPDPGTPESVQVPDLLTGVFELLSLLFLGLLAARRPRPRRIGRRWLFGAVPIAVLVGGLTTAAASAALNPLPTAVDMSTAPGDPGVTVMDLLREAPGPQPVRAFTLTAEVVRIGGREYWTYNGTVPGPELRANVGDRLRITLVNHLPQSTSIHWHGLRLPNAEDGVAGLTQHAVAPGRSYVYEFVLKDPGTYWYHSHQQTEEQVPLGLYGALVVETNPALSVDRDYVVARNDYGRGSGAVHLDARPGELVRLRLLNAIAGDMTGTPELLALVGAPYRVMALDGHDLNQPQTLGPELLPVGMGQRYDLEFRMPSGSSVRLLDLRPQTGGAVPLREWATIGTGPAPAQPAPGTLPTFDLTAYGLPAGDPVASRTHYDVSDELRIGEQLGFRYGSALPKAWELIHTFNGKSFPDTPPIVVQEGDSVRLHLVNDTAEYHPIHLHGHILSVIAKSGRRLTGSPVHLDSILVGPHETWDVAFLADNPGLWMLHCHVLIHAAYGLSTMVSYQGIHTPYTIGTRSGDFPE
jgi:FtsP/CotA-like multicopper oxidase with cupredoxin domain